MMMINHRQLNKLNILNDKALQFLYIATDIRYINHNMSDINIYCKLSDETHNISLQRGVFFLRIIDPITCAILTIFTQRILN